MRKLLACFLILTLALRGASAAALTSASQTLIDALVDTITLSMATSENITIECEYVSEANAVCVHMTYTGATSSMWELFDEETKLELRENFNELSVIFNDGKNSLSGLEDIAMVVTMTTEDGVPILLSCNGVDVSWMIAE